MPSTIHPVVRLPWPKAERLFPPGRLTSPPTAGKHYEVFTGEIFPVKGQGTISLTFKSRRPFRIVLTRDRQQSFGRPDVIVLDVGRRRTCLRRANNDADRDVLMEADTSALQAEGDDPQAPYWLSLDKNNRRIRVGRGEMLLSLMVMEFKLPPRPEKGTDPFGFIEDLHCIALSDISPSQVVGHDVSPLPVTLDPAPQIMAAEDVTLEHLAQNDITVVADLPQACQALYGAVGGPGVTLAPSDFPDFAAAIDYSIITPGCICYKKLAEKQVEHPGFGYLRITIDPNMGDSPGSPYVLEIWPAGNGSPIHDHGRACAVIKVLHGSIEVSLYPALSPEIDHPYGVVTLDAGTVTFLTPRYFQIHKLHNPAAQGMTATIQCYRYPDEDGVHYEYFDYVQDGRIQHFLPDSDWEYLDFKRLIKAEWDARKT